MRREGKEVYEQEIFLAAEKEEVLKAESAVRKKPKMRLLPPEKRRRVNSAFLKSPLHRMDRVLFRRLPFAQSRTGNDDGRIWRYSGGRTCDLLYA